MKITQHNIRKCIICRTKINKNQLIRLYWCKPNNEICIDKSNRNQGRGYYLCYNLKHINDLKKYRVLNKVFKTYICPENYDKIINYLESDIIKAKLS